MVALYTTIAPHFMFRRKKKVGRTLVKKVIYRPLYSPKVRKTRRRIKKRSKFLSGPKEIKLFSPRFKKNIILLLIVAGIIYLTYFLFFSGYFTIKKIEIETEEQDYFTAEDIKPHLKKIYGNNILTFKPLPIKENLKNNFPEIDQINIKKTLPDKIHIEILTSEIVANIINKMQNTQKKFEVNKNGILVIADLENLNLPYIVITSETEFQLRTQIIEPEKLDYIIKATKSFTEKFNLKVFDVQYYPIEREIHLRTEKHFVVWLDTEQSIEKQLNKLKRGLQEIDIYHTPLQYIDLRISGGERDQIIYKEK